MRIIGGEFKGRALKAPTWEGLRPTSDRLRETLFNVIAARVPDAAVLDVYAGTGAVGLEAISRGARLAVFVERDRRAAALIRENVERCGAGGRYAIQHASAETALGAPIAGGPFDLVVLDPPYDLPDLVTIVEQAVQQLAPGGVVILEHAWRREVPAAVAGARRVRTVRAGDSALSLFHPEEGERQDHEQQPG
ncbi:MAG: 16S rRNA (guanine(966)-N(2))-methyltransferase RsmD [Vicinamibacterales bacterium]|nr:16S rRNA (guanine(966)-N(2))-methyltransferase RsmD [Vicinamibacterales bacterium]